MKSKTLVIGLLVVVLASMLVLVAKASDVKVAVYLESANIDSNERANIVSALEVVEARFRDQLGHSVDLEIVGTWESRKDTQDSYILREDAIKKTDGVWIRLYDNFEYWLAWKFRRQGYTAAIYIIDQDLEGESISGAANPKVHACIVDYYISKVWKPMECLKSTIQHELSHLFGLGECHEEWCVMSYGYIPKEYWFLWWKTGEDWATEWKPDCKAKLLQSYDGVIWTRTYVLLMAGLYSKEVWTEEYHQWNLTQARLKWMASVTFPSCCPPSGPIGGSGYPMVVYNTGVTVVEP